MGSKAFCDFVLLRRPALVTLCSFAVHLDGLDLHLVSALGICGLGNALGSLGFGFAEQVGRVSVVV